jgi:hypothetical protein
MILGDKHLIFKVVLSHFIRYIERCGKPAQNVMAVVDFDLCFTYVSIGQPDSMHDTNVLYHALKADEKLS